MGPLAGINGETLNGVDCQASTANYSLSGDLAEGSMGR
jgi:hypothetical protein